MSASAPQQFHGQQFVLHNEHPKKIAELEFGMMSKHDIAKLAEFQVVNRDLYQQPKREPTEHGALDPRLGVSDKAGKCATCNKTLADCSGHFGYVKLIMPVFHVGYFKAVISTLQNICKTCSRVLVTEEERTAFLRKLRNPRTDYLQRCFIQKKLNEKCRKITSCMHCGATNGPVKKVGVLRIVHEKWGQKKTSEHDQDEFLRGFEEACRHNKDLKSFLNKAQDDLNPLRVSQLLKQMEPVDAELMDLQHPTEGPDRLLLSNIPVPPVCIRPSVCMDASAGSNEDDLTMKITEIVYMNGQLEEALNRGAPRLVMEKWEYLQLLCALYINSELPGLPANIIPAKPLRSLCQRLKGKTGRFRGNLSGKRVDFSGRTVISPDPNLAITEVAVPRLVAKMLTYPELVNDHNIKRLKQMIRNGPEKHPGAKFIEPASGFKRDLRYGDRSRIANELKIGDVVERHLCDGDVVLFNRQPSLHKVSIMAHRVRVFPWRTFRFNECVCTPYNADFDGDEMNLHVPQTEEARAEALFLMGVQHNLVTPRNGEPLVAATQDFLTASYLITKKNIFLDRAQFCQVCSYVTDGKVKITIPPPAIRKPVELWTGKQVISVLVCPSSDVEVKLNLENKGKSYTKNAYMCHQDGYVCFHNSELMCGTLDKATLGGGSKNSVFYVLSREVSTAYAALCMSRLAKLCARWLGEQGFSIGISDVTPSDVLTASKKNLVSEGYDQCLNYIRELEKGTLQLQPGCTGEQTLESIINGALSQIREDAGKLCIRELDWRNAPLTMALCGSKGSNINISQMVACVGQQTVNGKRVPNGFINRSLPHFRPLEKTPEAKGFVENSFFTGMTATEFFFHTMAGREGLVDTAVKTAETGYMSRRLMKALEDLSVQYDHTVRNSAGGIVQFIYGDDALEPSLMESKDGRPVDMVRALMHIRSKHSNILDVHMLPCDVIELAKSIVHNASADGKSPWNQANSLFKEHVMEFINAEAKRIASYREQLGLLGYLSAPTEGTAGVDRTDERELYVSRAALLSEQHVRLFLSHTIDRYIVSKVQPGEAVGAVGAQSIGEPGTQMTLKTFHFAGVASMNVTLGVPRIKEIINASKVISTPIITAVLVNNSDTKSARIVKGRIEKTQLGEICSSIKEIYTKSQCHLQINLDLDLLQGLQLDVNCSSVRAALIGHTKLKVKEKHIMISEPDRVMVMPPEDKTGTSVYYAMQTLRQMVPGVIVEGISTVERAVINNVGDKKYNLLVEGYDLRSVMATPGVDGCKTKSNHIIEVEKTLGIEAARKTIMDEIQYTMGSHGISIDTRHVMLLADVMSFKGEILGITRFGMAKMKSSVLMLASFEKTTDHLFDAALHNRIDRIDGVSECIIMGMPVPLGTGMFKLLQRVPRKVFAEPKKPLVSALAGLASSRKK